MKKFLILNLIIISLSSCGSKDYKIEISKSDEYFGEYKEIYTKKLSKSELISDYPTLSKYYNILENDESISDSTSYYDDCYSKINDEVIINSECIPLPYAKLKLIYDDGNEYKEIGELQLRP